MVGAPLVSIIVPVYNGEKFLVDTVSTLLAQTYRNLEVILVNDGSHDSSSKLITNLIEQDSRVRGFSKENGGIADARNYGIDRANGEFIALCDQDDEWAEDKLSLQLPEFDNPSVGLVYSHVMKKRMKEGESRLISNDNGEGRIFGSLVVENRIPTCTVMLRRRVLDDLGGFDNDTSLGGTDDWNLFLKFALVCEARVVRKPLATHVFHDSNFSSDASRMHRGELECIDRITGFVGSKRCQVNVDWVEIASGIHLKYARTYVNRGEFKKAAQAISEARVDGSNISFIVVVAVYKWVPERMLRWLQGVRRTVLGL